MYQRDGDEQRTAPCGLGGNLVSRGVKSETML